MRFWESSRTVTLKVRAWYNLHLRLQGVRMSGSPIEGAGCNVGT